MIALGEGRAAVDLMRREVDAARAARTADPLQLLLQLLRYAEVLEKADALAESDFIRAEAVEIVVSSKLRSLDAVEAYLGYGLLLCKMHNYDGAVANLREAVLRAEALPDALSLRVQIVLAQAWRAEAQAFEALGELSQASNALDALIDIKRQIRFLVFAHRRGSRAAE